MRGLGGAPSSASAVPPASGDGGGTQVLNEGWAHVPEGTPVSYRSNPSASGPHYPVWAHYQEYKTAVERPYWVHNLEHGAIVLLYRPDATADAVDAVALQAFALAHRNHAPEDVCASGTR